MRKFCVFRDESLDRIQTLLLSEGAPREVSWKCSFCTDSFAWSAGGFSLWETDKMLDKAFLQTVVFDRPPATVVLADGNAYSVCSSECMKHKAFLVALEVQNQALVAAIKKIAEKLS